MALPSIKQPTFNDVLPDGRKFVFRPFNVEEQKNVLVAAQGGDETNLIRNIVDLVNACTFGKIDFYKETMASFEKAFLSIRAKSVGEIIEIGFRCLNEVEDTVCNHKNYQEVDYLNDTIFDESPDALIKIDDTIQVKLKPIIMEDVINDHDIEDHHFLYEHVEMIIDGEEVFTEFSFEEFEQFATAIPTIPWNTMVEFFQNQSSASLEIPTLCKKCKNESSVTIKGAVNFFG